MRRWVVYVRGMAAADTVIPAATRRMMLRMKERVSISVERDVLETVREEVAAGAAPNLSAAIEVALRERARARALDRLLGDFAARYPDQPLTEAERSWAREALGGRGTADE
jgi:hypothetical protein